MYFDTKALSGALVALFIGVLALLLVPSDVSRISIALGSRPIHHNPPIPYFVHRASTDEIVLAASSGRTFLMVEGGNRMGKTVAVKSAAAHLSRTHTVLWCNCSTTSTLDTVLQRLFGLRRTLVLDALFNVLRVSMGPPAEVQDLVLSRAPSHPEPVLVVERAEMLPLPELKRLVDFAKEMVDAGLGRFIFVFSPSEKLTEVSKWGAMSRAKVIPVLDLSRGEALELLGHFCTPTQASTVYNLLGGHLPHLMDDATPLFCAGGLSEDGLHQHFASLVDNKLKAVARLLGCSGGRKCACAACCAITGDEWDHPSALQAQGLLLSQHLIRASLLQQNYAIDSFFVRTFLRENCNCSHSWGALGQGPQESVHGALLLTF